MAVFKEYCCQMHFESVIRLYLLKYYFCPGTGLIQQPPSKSFLYYLHSIPLTGELREIIKENSGNS